MRISLIVLRTKNIELLSKFYEKIGLSFSYHRHGNGPFHYSTELENIVFEIYPLLKDQKAADTSLRLGFDVNKLDDLIVKLRKEKVEIVKEPIISEWGYFAIIKDLDGRKVELTEKI